MACHADAWVATASADRAHLVPLTYAWDGTHVVLATAVGSVTEQNLRTSPTVRLAFGDSRDVVMIDGVLEEVAPVRESASAIGEIYAAQADWDPRHSDGDHVYLLVRPQRVQVWREVDEIRGRSVMRDGAWID